MAPFLFPFFRQRYLFWLVDETKDWRLWHGWNVIAIGVKCATRTTTCYGIIRVITSLFHRSWTNSCSNLQLNTTNLYRHTTVYNRTTTDNYINHPRWTQFLEHTLFWGRPTSQCFVLLPEQPFRPLRCDSTVKAPTEDTKTALRNPTFHAQRSIQVRQDHLSYPPIDEWQTEYK